MRLADIFKEDRQVFSFEVFPPKPTSPVQTIYDTLDVMKDLKPDYISVTYGAGGNEISTLSVQIAKDIKEKYGIESLAHLTCINYDKEQMKNVIDEFKSNGIENILALRGDVNPNVEQTRCFKYASDLVAMIKEYDCFDIAGACYPEGHVECRTLREDIKNLKKKIDAGVTHLNSQLFFDNEIFYKYLEKVRKAGVKVPIQAGIMPVTSKSQIERMVTLCGASLPIKFVKMMQRYEHSKEALVDAGIAYATDQIVDLLANGVDGIHLYTMNRPEVAKKITNNIKSLLSNA